MNTTEILIGNHILVRFSDYSEPIFIGNLIWTNNSYWNCGKRVYLEDVKEKLNISDEDHVYMKLKYKESKL